MVGGGATLPMPTATVLLILFQESLISRFGRSCQEVLALAAGFLFFFLVFFLVEATSSIFMGLPSSGTLLYVV